MADESEATSEPQGLIEPELEKQSIVVAVEGRKRWIGSVLVFPSQTLADLRTLIDIELNDAPPAYTFIMPDETIIPHDVEVTKNAVKHGPLVILRPEVGESAMMASPANRRGPWTIQVALHGESERLGYMDVLSKTTLEDCRRLLVKGESIPRRFDFVDCQSVGRSSGRVVPRKDEGKFKVMQMIDTLTWCLYLRQRAQTKPEAGLFISLEGNVANSIGVVPIFKGMSLEDVRNYIEDSNWVGLPGRFSFRYLKKSSRSYLTHVGGHLISLAVRKEMEPSIPAIECLPRIVIRSLDLPMAAKGTPLIKSRKSTGESRPRSAAAANTSTSRHISGGFHEQFVESKADEEPPEMHAPRPKFKGSHVRRPRRPKSASPHRLIPHGNRSYDNGYLDYLKKRNTRDSQEIYRREAADEYPMHMVTSKAIRRSKVDKQGSMRSIGYDHSTDELYMPNMYPPSPGSRVRIPRDVPSSAYYGVL